MTMSQKQTLHTNNYLEIITISNTDNTRNYINSNNAKGLQTTFLMGIFIVDDKINKINPQHKNHILIRFQRRRVHVL